MNAAPEIAIVYQARNLVNGHRYIGFTTQSVEKRAAEHFKTARGGWKKFRFQHAIRKYGAENFVFETLGDFDGDVDLAKLYEIEAIAKYRPEYNISEGGDGGPIDEATRQKISAAHKGRKKPWLVGRPISAETRAKIGAAHKGHPNYNTKPVSEETRQKLRDKFKGRKPWNTGMVFGEDRLARMSALRKAEHLRDTPERRAQMRETAKNISNVLRKPVECVTDGNRFESIADAARFYGYSKAYLSNVLKGRFKPIAGLAFRYLDEQPE